MPADNPPDDVLIAKGTPYDVRLLQEVHLLVQKMTSLQNTADETIRNSEILKPMWLKGINWYRLCYLLVNAVGSIGILCLWLWLNSNFVSVSLNDKTWQVENARNKEAWSEQKRSNQEVLEKLKDLGSDLKVYTEVNTKVNDLQDASLKRIENELVDQRRTLVEKK